MKANIRTTQLDSLQKYLKFLSKDHNFLNDKTNNQQNGKYFLN